MNNQSFNESPQGTAQATTPSQENTKFCKHCGSKIPVDAVLCTHCGRQVEELHKANADSPQIVINNSNANNNVNQNTISTSGSGRAKSKWTAFFLCLFLGYLGAHKFYEGKPVAGILYAFTWGFFFIGWFIDCIVLLTKPDPYYV